MSISRSTQPELIQDIIVKSDKTLHGIAVEATTLHVLARLSFPARQRVRIGSPKKLSAKAQAKREAELSDLYNRFRKHPEYDNYNGM